MGSTKFKRSSKYNNRFKIKESEVCTINKKLTPFQYAEEVAEEVSKIANEKQDKTIDSMIVYDCIKEKIDDISIMDEVFSHAIYILQYRFNVKFDIDKTLYM